MRKTKFWIIFIFYIFVIFDNSYGLPQRTTTTTKGPSQAHLFQCPCILKPGTKECLQYDIRYQAATIDEAVSSFLDLTLSDEPNTFMATATEAPFTTMNAPASSNPKANDRIQTFSGPNAVNAEMSIDSEPIPKVNGYGAMGGAGGAGAGVADTIPLNFAQVPQAQACEEVLKERLQQVGLLQPAQNPSNSQPSQPIKCDKYRFSRTDPSVYTPRHHDPNGDGDDSVESDEKDGDDSDEDHQQGPRKPEKYAHSNDWYGLNYDYGSGSGSPWPHQEPQWPDPNVPWLGKQDNGKGLGVNFHMNQGQNQGLKGQKTNFGYGQAQGQQNGYGSQNFGSNGQYQQNFVPPKGNQQGYRYKRQTVQDLVGTRYNLSCTLKGVDDGSGFLNLCSKCWAWRQLPTNYFPQYINELVCDTSDSDCLSGYASCGLGTRVIEVLRNDSGVMNVVTLTAGSYCECKVRAGSTLQSLVAGQTPPPSVQFSTQFSSASTISQGAQPQFRSSPAPNPPTRNLPIIGR